MHAICFYLAIGLCTSSALIGLGHAHGGPPYTRKILSTAGDISLWTTHGFFSEETAWAWVCDEATGADVAASVARTPNFWFAGTFSGIRYSEDGCQWGDIPALRGRYLFHIQADEMVHDLLWAATAEGLWGVREGHEAHLDLPSPFSLRHFGQQKDGSFLLLGFDGAQPIADLDGQRMPLPTKAGRMAVLSRDDNDRFYVRFARGLQDQLMRLSVDGVEILRDRTEPVYGVESLDGHIYLLQRKGIAWSSDDGATWSAPRGRPVRCLHFASDVLYGCPLVGENEALLLATPETPDPGDWNWTTVLSFNEVSPNVCPDGSTVTQVCALFWPTVQKELGLVPISTPAANTSTQTTEVSEARGQGCATLSAIDDRKKPQFWLYLMLTLISGWRAHKRSCSAHWLR